ncbi:hypothetical protein [Geodermatophilus chilensis]|uniref:hypothetical protein n=1 Tax=Geodermatophilus chilensis TaxID=2035835 RepID=UPI000C25B0C3|nr:hypothetical protein [Geodermatophilus chilensis]
MTGLYRALPGPVIDLITDGAPATDLRNRGDRAVWSALVRTAASARQHGWTFADWHAKLSEAKSTLGKQARLKKGTKERTRTDWDRTLGNAWDTAGRWLAKAPPPQGAAEVAARVAAVREAVADVGADLTDTERAILAHAADIAERNRTDRPAVPRDATADALGMGQKAVRCALDRLDRRGVLVRAVPGRRASEESGRRRSALYHLPTPEAITTYLYRGTRSIGPSAQVYRPSSVDLVQAPAQVYRPPSADPAPSTEEPPVAITVTITAPDPAALAGALDALRREQAVAVEPQPPQLAVIAGGLADDDGGRPSSRRRPRPRDPAEPEPVPGQLALPGTGQGGDR